MTEADDGTTAQEPLEPPEPGGDKEGTRYSGASRGSVATRLDWTLVPEL